MDKTLQELDKGLSLVCQGQRLGCSLGAFSSQLSKPPSSTGVHRLAWFFWGDELCGWEGSRMRSAAEALEAKL